MSENPDMGPRLYMRMGHVRNLFFAGYAHASGTDSVYVICTQMVGAINYSSCWPCFDDVSTLFLAIDRKDVAVSIHVVACNVAPVLFTKHWPGIMPLQGLTITDLFWTASFRQ